MNRVSQFELESHQLIELIETNYITFDTTFYLYNVIFENFNILAN